MRVRIARVKETFGTTANLQTKGRNVVTLVDDLYRGMIHNLFQDIGQSEVGALWHCDNFSMHQINVVVSENDVETEMIHLHDLSAAGFREMLHLCHALLRFIPKKLFS